MTSAYAASVTTPVAQPRDAKGDNILFDPGVSGADPFSGEARVSDAVPRPGPAQAATPMPELPRPALIQIVEAMRAGATTVDVTLSPEELGRVTLSLGTQDGVLNVIVQAERPETADLIRRSLDMLLAEAQDAGFEDVAFGFGGSGQEAGQGEDQEPQDQAPAPAGSGLSSELAISSARSASTGLDLRL